MQNQQEPSFLPVPDRLMYLSPPIKLLGSFQAYHDTGARSRLSSHAANKTIGGACVVQAIHAALPFVRDRRR